METTQVLISSPIGVLAVLCIVAAFFFMIAEFSDAKFFNYVPPLLFIYATPVFLSNLTIAGFNVIPTKSIIYTGLSQYALPVFIVLIHTRRMAFGRRFARTIISCGQAGRTSRMEATANSRA